MKKLIFILVMTFSLCYGSELNAFGPITHYNINKSVWSQGGLICSFCTMGIMPDAFIGAPALPPFRVPANGIESEKLQVPWVDAVHAPNPKEEPFQSHEFSFAKSPNFAYLLLYAAKSAEEVEFALGWGGHIAADWVAHNFLLIPDFSDPNESFTELLIKVGVFLGHVTTEGSVDIYNFYKRGPIPTKFTFRPEQVWKGFVNWKLKEIQEYV